MSIEDSGVPADRREYLTDKDLLASAYLEIGEEKAAWWRQRALIYTVNMSPAEAYYFAAWMVHFAEGGDV